MLPNDALLQKVLIIIAVLVNNLHISKSKNYETTKKKKINNVLNLIDHGEPNCVTTYSSFKGFI